MIQFSLPRQRKLNGIKKPINEQKNNHSIHRVIIWIYVLIWGAFANIGSHNHLAKLSLKFVFSIFDFKTPLIEFLICFSFKITSAVIPVLKI